MKQNSKRSLTRILTTSSLITASAFLAYSSYKDYIMPIHEVNYRNPNNIKLVDYDQYGNDLTETHNNFWIKACVSGMLLTSGLAFMKYSQEMEKLKQDN